MADYTTMKFLDHFTVLCVTYECLKLTSYALPIYPYSADFLEMCMFFNFINKTTPQIVTKNQLRQIMNQRF